jgi:hypothetical protein
VPPTFVTIAERPDLVEAMRSPPFRPTRKDLEPFTPIADYLTRRLTTAARTILGCGCTSG